MVAHFENLVMIVVVVSVKVVALVRKVAMNATRCYVYLISPNALAGHGGRKRTINIV